MGRHAGFIAAHAALASQDVDLCLIPEVPIQLEGQRGCLPHLERVLHAQGHAVVVVAEGAGEELLREECADGACDASGNRALPPIGPFIQSRITHYFKARGMETTIKYIDPSYMIRSVPPSASDSLFCLLLAQNAVHGVMAGTWGVGWGGWGVVGWKGMQRVGRGGVAEASQCCAVCSPCSLTCPCCQGSPDS